jgi:nucleotide-binding universal stress UspA family protein
VSYARLMVHLELGQSNAGRLRVVTDIAQRFQAEVVGIAVCRPMSMASSEGYVPAEIIDQDRERIEKDTMAAEAEFRSGLQGRVTKVEWRSAVTFSSLSNYIACEARSVDLVVTGVTPGKLLDNSRSANLGDLIMQLGRPVLVVPAAPGVLKLDRVVVGWKDTREARRAVSDALPLLKAAAQVTVVEIAGEDELAAARSHVEDVVDWLERHGVRAKALTLTSTGDDSTQLNAIAHERGANLIVAGAYGHSRLREWALGGVWKAPTAALSCPTNTQFRAFSGAAWLFGTEI